MNHHVPRYLSALQVLINTDTEKYFTLFVWKKIGWARTKLLILITYNQISIKIFVGVFAGCINILD